MNANNSKSDGKQHQRFSEEKERSNEYQQEYKAKTVNDLLDELDHVVPKDPGSKGDQFEAKPASLLEMPPVVWPDSFSILGSALDDLSYFNSFSKSAPEKKSLLGRPGSHIFSNSNIDVNDPHFQSLVQKQIEMANKLKMNDDMPSSSTTNAASNHKPSSSKKNSRWSYDDPFSTSENLNDDDKTIFFDNPPPCLLYKGMDSYQQSSSYPQRQGYDGYTDPMPYGYINPYKTHHNRRKKHQENSGQNKRPYDNVTRRGGFNSSKSYTKRFCKSAPNLRGRGGAYGKRGGGSLGGRPENRSSKYSSNVDNYGSNEETSSHFDNGLPREFGKKESSFRKYGKKHDPSSSKHSREIGRNKFYSSHDFHPSFSRSPPRSRLSSRRSPHRNSRSRSRSPIYAKSDKRI